MKDKATEPEITAFCKELGLSPTDAEWVFYKWLGNGWKNDGKPIKSWKATIRCWKAGGFFPSQKTAKFGTPKPTPSQSGLIRGWGTNEERRA